MGPLRFDEDFDLDSNVESTLLAASVYFGIPQHKYNATVDDDVEDEEVEDLHVSTLMARD